MQPSAIQHEEPGDEEELEIDPGVAPDRRLVWLTAALLLSLWGVLIYQVSSDWLIVPEYAYGWSVPFLALFIFYKRWITRPEPEAAEPHVLVSAAALTALLCYLPVRMLHEANHDWRMATWALALQAIGLTYFALYYAGGRAWLRHFWFCIAFFLVAVPWSRGAEHKLTQTLMPVLAQCTVEALVWFNIPSIRQGNLIEIANGLVGIDEACSGIRSIQATLMASLFLGELYRFRWSRRFFLVVAGAVLALASNGVRAFFLAYVAAREGIAATAKFHDPAGFTILYVCFGALWAVAFLFRGRVDLRRRAAPIRFARALPGPVLIGLMGWLVIAEVTTQGWFIYHEKNLVANPRWTIKWPERAGLRDILVPDAVRNTLGFDQGRGVEWTETDGTKWAMFFMRWESGNATIQGVKYHKPDICLPAAGRVLKEDLGVEVMDVNGYKIPMRWFLFSEYGKPLYAFYCLSEDLTWPSAQPFSMENNSRWSLIRRAMEGKRGEFGQQVAQVFISGVDQNDRARSAFKELLEKVVK